MRIFVSTHVVPWPPESGSTIRMAATIDALAELGEVDVVCVLEPGGASRRTVPTDVPARSVHLVERPPRPRGPVARARWLATGRLPWKLNRDLDGVREQVRRDLPGAYDLAWLGRAEGFATFGREMADAVVCDLDDLEDHKLTPGRGDRVGSSLSRFVTDVDRRRWAALQRRIVDQARVTIVCSDLDQARLGGAGVAVVPNVYPPPIEVAGDRDVGDPPIVTFVGLLTYAPNVEAAHHLVHRVLPPLQRRVPDVRVRLVGRHDRRCAELDRVPGVELVGFAEDLVAELRRADVIAVPLLSGSGTRIKILEAFAHRIPVVSTSVGCEGLDVVPDGHLLVADDAEGFAESTARLLDDAPLRGRLISSAWDHWDRWYRPSALRAAVAETVTTLGVV